MPKNYNAEEFKKFILACIWEKRIPKNEILMMNLVQNIQTLSQAVKDDHIPLKQALKILIGLQKVYVRRMSYLYDDTQVVLKELLAPISGEEKHVKDEQIQMSKRKKKAGGIHGYQAPSMKLDLKNSKWWQPGFDN